MKKKHIFITVVFLTAAAYGVVKYINRKKKEKALMNPKVDLTPTDSPYNL